MYKGMLKLIMKYYLKLIRLYKVELYPKQRILFCNYRNCKYILIILKTLDLAI